MYQNLGTKFLMITAQLASAIESVDKASTMYNVIVVAQVNVGAQMFATSTCSIEVIAHSDLGGSRGMLPQKIMEF